jgi:hypothetical protein
MTDADWFAADAPEPLIAHLRSRPRADDGRSIFLYATACYRLNWDDHDPAIRAVFEMLEARVRHPGGIASARSAIQPILSLFAGDPTGALTQAVALSGAGAWNLATMATQATRPLGATAALQADLLREFHPPPSWSNDALRPEWRSATLNALVRQVAAFDDFHLLPLVADVLADAGCTDDRVLSHARHAGGHRYGCWLVTALAAAV